MSTNEDTTTQPLNHVDDLNVAISNSNNDMGVIGSPSSSFEATIDILEISSEQKVLGELVYFISQENKLDILSLGQITEVSTVNKWHEEPSFKAVIKRHGTLPHLSGDADNRVATLAVQSSFSLNQIEQKITPAQLCNSPSTGKKIARMTNEVMGKLVKPIALKTQLECLGNAYGTTVKIPFWFKHFGDGVSGARDAYHIGVFGKTGSGKTNTAARMLEGYAKHAKHMNFLILDPQEQFYEDNKVLHNRKFEDAMIDAGIEPAKYTPVKIPTDIALPSDPELFAELLLSAGFIRRCFNIQSEDKSALMALSITEYIEGRLNNPGFSLSTETAEGLLKSLIHRFASKNNAVEDSEGCSCYVSDVYARGQYRNALINRIETADLAFQANNFVDHASVVSMFDRILKLFQTTGPASITLDALVNNITGKNTGYMYIVNLSPRLSIKIGSDNFNAKLIDLLLTKIIERAEELSANGDKSNCLIVMDEAHRYVNSSANHPRLRELNKKIIDSVRTVRKYGIGHMFITQTIDSLDDEVIQQMRIFGFGYGLTMGKEFSKVKQIINDDNAAKFYKSFIDPGSNRRFPFMFHGPISPLSFTGSPLFLEMN